MFFIASLAKDEDLLRRYRISNETDKKEFETIKALYSDVISHTYLGLHQSDQLRGFAFGLLMMCQWWEKLKAPMGKDVFLKIAEHASNQPGRYDYFRSVDVSSWPELTYFIEETDYTIEPNSSTPMTERILVLKSTYYGKVISGIDDHSDKIYKYLKQEYFKLAFQLKPSFSTSTLFIRVFEKQRQLFPNEVWRGFFNQMAGKLNGYFLPFLLLVQQKNNVFNLNPEERLTFEWQIFDSKNCPELYKSYAAVYLTENALLNETEKEKLKKEICNWLGAAYFQGHVEFGEILITYLKLAKNEDDFYQLSEWVKEIFLVRAYHHRPEEWYVSAIQIAHALLDIYHPFDNPPSFNMEHIYQVYSRFCHKNQLESSFEFGRLLFCLEEYMETKNQDRGSRQEKG